MLQLKEAGTYGLQNANLPELFNYVSTIALTTSIHQLKKAGTYYVLYKKFTHKKNIIQFNSIQFKTK